MWSHFVQFVDEGWRRGAGGVIIVIALFPACSQAGSLRSLCMWFWMKWCTDNQFGCYMAGAMWNCCGLGASSVYTIQPCTSLQCRFIQSRTGRVHMYLAVTCTCTFGKMTGIFYELLQQHRGGTDTEMRVSTESWPWRKKFSHFSSRDSNPGLFNHESRALTTELMPTPPFLRLTLNLISVWNRVSLSVQNTQVLLWCEMWLNVHDKGPVWRKQCPGTKSASGLVSFHLLCSLKDAPGSAIIVFYVLKKPVIVMIQQSLDSHGFFVLSFGTKSAEDMQRNGVLPGPVTIFLVSVGAHFLPFHTYLP